MIRELEYSIGIKKTQKIDELKLYYGDRLRISGRNGSGKSTLVTLINQVIEKTEKIENSQYLSGEITVDLSIDSSQVFFFQQRYSYGEMILLYEYIHRQTKINTFQIPGILKKLELTHYDMATSLNTLSLGELIRLKLGLLAL